MLDPKKIYRNSYFAYFKPFFIFATIKLLAQNSNLKNYINL